MQHTAVPSQEHLGLLKDGVRTCEPEPDPGFADFAADQQRNHSKGSVDEQGSRGEEGKYIPADSRLGLVVAGGGKVQRSREGGEMEKLAEEGGKISDSVSSPASETAGGAARGTIKGFEEQSLSRAELKQLSSTHDMVSEAVVELKKEVALLR